jgi:phosphoglycerate dehydrogenase-like enzyme
MKVAAGRSFFERVHTEACEIAPDLHWALAGADGSWSESPEDCDLVVLAGEVYTGAFVEAVLKLPAILWAHTEDAGTDGLFYDTMRARGVTVTHSPGANAPEVAEFTLALMLWSAKRLGELHDNQRAHRWQLLSLDTLRDKTLLVIGLGAIGSRVAALAKAFGMYVLGIRRSSEMLAHVDAQGTLADLSGFLSVADFVVLALPFTEEQRGLIDRSALALMKPTAVLINVARGAIVDVVALKEALQAKRLRAACLDVLPTEPWPVGDDLWDTPRLFLTPHTAWSSPLYLPRVASVWLENLQRYVRGDELLHVIPPPRTNQ